MRKRRKGHLQEDSSQIHFNLINELYDGKGRVLFLMKGDKVLVNVGKKALTSEEFLA